MEVQNIDFIINGELYLKRGQEIYNQSEKVREIDDKISSIEFEMSKENYDSKYKQMLDMYQILRNSVKNDKDGMSYRGTNSFWQLFTNDGQEITLSEINVMGNGLIRKYHSKESLDKDFVKLSSFLKKSVFVGRELRRIKPVKRNNGGPEDKSYMGLSSFKQNTIVLYATQDLFLVMKSNEYGKGYALINSIYTLDGNYEFFGPVYEEYRDRNKVYTEILRQVKGYNKGRTK